MKKTVIGNYMSSQLQQSTGEAGGLVNIGNPIPKKNQCFDCD
jgi:hypothetical protein